MKPSINLIADPSAIKITGQIIPNAAALQMIQLYQSNYGGMPYKSFAAKFTFNELTQIGDLIQQTGSDGFALYYSLYPLDGSLNPAGKLYSGRQTIVVVPTKKGIPIIDLTASPSTYPNARGDAFNHGDLEP